MKTTTPMTTSIARLIALGLGLAVVLMSQSALARGRALSADFRELGVYDNGRQGILVDYILTKRSWRAIRDARIVPTLQIEVRATYDGGVSANSVYSVALTTRRGEVQLPRALRLYGAKRVRVSVEGKRRRWAITQMSLGKRQGAVLKLRVRNGRPVAVQPQPVQPPTPVQPPPPAQPPRDMRAEIITACKSATRWDSEFDQCFARAKKLVPAEAPAVVAACDKATTFASDLNTCLDRAARFKRFNPAGAINACDTATRHGSELNACIDHAAALITAPSRLIRACDEVTRFNSDFQGCLRASRKLGPGGAKIVRACGGSRQSNGVVRCIQRAATPTQVR